MKPIIIRGAGDIATGTIYALKKAGYPVIVSEIDKPTAIRRTVALSEAIYTNKSKVEDLECVLFDSFDEALNNANENYVPIIVDGNLSFLRNFKPDILVDAILAKKNIGTTIDMAKLTIALGPGFEAGVDVNYVIETMRGHRLGRIIDKGCAIPNTGIPGLVGGASKERVIHAPASGIWHIVKDIGDVVELGDVISTIENEIGTTEVKSELSGLIRGNIREGFIVTKGLKVADIDPRVSEKDNCYLISDKARCIAGSVLLLVTRFANNN